MSKSTKIDISIIIPNLNSPIINKTISSLINQDTLYSYEIIVVGQDKYDLVDKFPKEKVTHIHTKNPTPPAISRNIGVENSSGDYIFFIDADCISTKNWLNSHINTHKMFNKPILVGGSVTFSSENYLALVDNIATFHEYMQHLPSGNREQLPSLNLSFPRLIWEKYGGFDTNYPFPAGEDAEFTTRLSSKKILLHFNPEAVIFHDHSRKNISSIVKHAFHFGKYSIKGQKKYQSFLKIPILLKYKPLTFLFSPILAGSVILKILFSERLPIKYWKTLPTIYLLKLIWCFGYISSPNVIH